MTAPIALPRNPRKAASRLKSVNGCGARWHALAGNRGGSGCRRVPCRRASQ
jgi:hypothetical protein